MLIKATFIVEFDELIQKKGYRNFCSNRIGQQKVDKAVSQARAIE